MTVLILYNCLHSDLVTQDLPCSTNSFQSFLCRWLASVRSTPPKKPERAHPKFVNLLLFEMLLFRKRPIVQANHLPVFGERKVLFQHNSQVVSVQMSTWTCWSFVSNRSVPFDHESLLLKSNEERLHYRH